MTFPRLASASLLATTLAASSTAFAFQQPDGTVIPTGNGLQGMFQSRNENINAINDANVVPETFTPGCALTFEVLQRNAGYMNSFGWYNVTGQAPAISDLHEFLTCTDGVGTKKVLDIKSDPNYKGGKIGFYQATGNCATLQDYLNIFYSEKAWNPDGASYYHLLIFNSTVTPKAFYFGWEDLLSGGDNDFDDLTTFVTGISCAGGGGSCDTGKPGVCATGTLQCQVGQLTCVGSTQPSAEKCDGVDNDCNGTIDEGSLCPTDFVCEKGSCVPKCGKDNCPVGTTCDATGVCVETACLTVTCPAGKKCVGGMCAGPCDGVKCPVGLACIAGACVDPCVGLTCDKDQVCDTGVCVDNCNCSGCGTGKSCEASGLCVPTSCVGKTCPTGQYCDPASGACADSCTGVVCPDKGVCKNGACVPPPAGTGGMGGAAGAAGAAGKAGSAGAAAGTGGAAGAAAGAAGAAAGTGGAAGKAGAAGASGAAGKAGAAGAAGAAAGAAGAAGKAGAAGAAGASAGGKAGSATAGTGGATGGKAGAAGKAGSAAAGTGGVSNGAAPTADPGSTGGCGCAVPGQGSSYSGLALVVAALAAAARRRKSRDE